MMANAGLDAGGRIRPKVFTESQHAMTPTTNTTEAPAPVPASPTVPPTPTPESELSADERRRRNIPVAIDRRRQNAAEKRRTSERRRLIDPTTCERDYNEDETLFMKTMERYKRENRRPFPTWSEVLEVLISMGYRKVEPQGDLPGIKREAAPPKG